MTIKFNISYHHGAGFGRVSWTPAEALALVRKHPGTKTLPVRPLTGDDFADFHQRIILAELGYFSIDLPAHRERRDEEARVEEEIAIAYRVMGINRKAEYDKIAGAIPNSEGTWPRSTARYAQDVQSLDNSVLAHADDFMRDAERGKTLRRSLSAGAMTPFSHSAKPWFSFDHAAAETDNTEHQLRREMQRLPSGARSARWAGLKGGGYRVDHFSPERREMTWNAMRERLKTLVRLPTNEELRDPFVAVASTWKGTPVEDKHASIAYRANRALLNGVTDSAAVDFMETVYG